MFRTKIGAIIFWVYKKEVRYIKRAQRKEKYKFENYVFVFLHNMKYYTIVSSKIILV